MRRILSVALILAFALCLCPAAFADSTPPGYTRLSEDELLRLCDEVNSDNDGSCTWRYDKDLGAIVIDFPYPVPDDADKALIRVVNAAENGDENAKNRLFLLDYVCRDYYEKTISSFYQSNYFVNLVIRYTDPSENGAVGVEYIDGVRSSFRPSTGNSGTAPARNNTTATEQRAESGTPTVAEANALKKANSYLKTSAFSYSKLIEQLEYVGFTHDEAVYGADNCGADWYEQAAKKAESYLKTSAFSRDRLISQLEYVGFTHEQAEYGVSQNGL